MFITVSNGPGGERAAAQVRTVSGRSILLARKEPKSTNDEWVTWWVNLDRPDPNEGWFPVGADAALLRGLISGETFEDRSYDYWMCDAADGVLKLRHHRKILEASGAPQETRPNDDLFQALSARDTWASLVEQCRDALGLRPGQDLLRAIKAVRARAEIERGLYPAAEVQELLKHLKALRQDRADAIDLAMFIDELEVEKSERYLGGPRSDARTIVADILRRGRVMPKNAVTARLVDETVKRCRHCSERAGKLHSLTCSAIHYGGAAKIVDLKWCGDTDPPEGEGG